VPTRAEIETQLTGPGGPFEVVEEAIDGVSTRMYQRRFASLRDVPALTAGRSDQTYLVYGPRRISFGDFTAQANGLSAALVGLGIGHGDRVAVLSANNPEWVQAFWGVVDIGSVLVGLNGWWKTDEILYGLADSGARVLVADRGRFTRIAGSLGELPALEHVYLIDADPAEFGNDPRLHPFAELVAQVLPEPPPAEIAEGDPAVIFYTSGTTGRPKGAVSTHRSMVANLQNTMYNAVANMLLVGASPGADGGRQTSSLMSSPLFHVSGCHSGIVVGLAGGAKSVMIEGRFDPEKAMQLIQDEQVNVWGAVPTMVWRVVEHPRRHEYDLSSVTTVAYGGSPSAGELQRRVRETFPNLRTMGNVYGLTESSSAATIISGQEFIERPDSVGKPLPVVELRVVDPGDPGGPAVEAGQVGEVWIKGPIVMPGYWGKPEATAETITEGWLHTGDLGYLDSDGYLFITDRAKDMIIRGGENVYCVEIENRLIEHPAVAEAAVFGVPHPTLGEEVKAVVRLEPGVAAVSVSELQAWVAETLADFKVPASVEFSDRDLPRNPSGKLLKNVLRGAGEVSFAETL
jgi:long-chain acyl-CoA synthetase